MEDNTSTPEIKEITNWIDEDLDNKASEITENTVVINDIFDNIKDSDILDNSVDIEQQSQAISEIRDSISDANIEPDLDFDNVPEEVTPEVLVLETQVNPIIQAKLDDNQIQTISEEPLTNNIELQEEVVQTQTEVSVEENVSEPVAIIEEKAEVSETIETVQEEPSNIETVQQVVENNHSPFELGVEFEEHLEQADVVEVHETVVETPDPLLEELLSEKSVAEQIAEDFPNGINVPKPELKDPNSFEIDFEKLDSNVNNIPNDSLNNFDFLNYKPEDIFSSRNNFFEPVKLNLNQTDEADEHISSLFNEEVGEINSFVYEERIEKKQSFIDKILNINSDMRKNLIVASTITLGVAGVFTAGVLFFQSGSSNFVANASPLTKIMSQNLMTKTQAIKEQIILGQLYSDDDYISYPVKAGETLADISSKTNVPQETIKLVNNITSDKDMSDLSNILIPTVEGIIHRIAPRETIESIAIKYKVPIKDIAALNKKNLKSINFIQINQPLFIPIRDKAVLEKKEASDVKAKKVTYDTTRKLAIKKNLESIKATDEFDTFSREGNFIHKLAKGEKLENIAKKYRISMNTLLEANKSLNIWRMKPNQPIIVPINKINRNASRARIRLASRSLSVATRDVSLKATNRFFWPAVGEFSSGFGPRGGGMHHGIDIAAEVGTPIHAVMNGKVSYCAWKSGYGLTVEITHNNGLVTRYAHCSDVYVKVGQNIDGGKTIAAIGMTGHVTGPHVHFEVLVNGYQVNPMKYL